MDYDIERSWSIQDIDRHIDRVTQMSLKCSQREPRGNPRNSKSPIELSCESELMFLVKVSISLESEFDPES